MTEEQFAILKDLNDVLRRMVDTHFQDMADTMQADYLKTLIETGVGHVKFSIDPMALTAELVRADGQYPAMKLFEIKIPREGLH